MRFLPAILLAAALGCTGGHPKNDDGFRRMIDLGMTREEVRKQVGPPDRGSRVDLWDYKTGGPEDPVYRIVFEKDRVAKVVRYDGYFTVDR